MPAAIHVISAEDIRRSGATSIPELLRLAPGVQVARIDANKWAISVRGFNSRWSNKLLVLIDGRSVYTPAFSGVFWDVQDTLLEDIERIEVIRGPGAAMWGANAVNGVINVITRHARETQGTLASAGGGSEERGFGELRYGGAAGPVFYRVYSKYFKRNHLFTAEGRPATDGWDALRGGFRADWERSRRDAFRLQGEIYRGGTGQQVQIYSLLPPYQTSFPDEGRSGGGHVLANWRHVFAGGSESEFQFYFDRAERSDALFRAAVDTYDAEWNHRAALSRRHDLQWGMETRVSSDGLLGRAIGRLEPAGRTQALLGAHIQDEIEVFEDRLFLTVGSKFEHHPYSGFDWQPQAQVLWAPNSRSTMWASLARALRTPSRLERDTQVPFGAVVAPGGYAAVLVAVGNAGFRSEILHALEMGYRGQISGRFSLDVTGFYKVYGDLASLEEAAPYLEYRPAPAHLVIPFVFTNAARAHSDGMETAASWAATENWKLSGSYSWLEMHPHAPAGVSGAAKPLRQQQGQLRSYLDVARQWNFDAAVYYMGALPAISGPLPQHAVPAYLRLDARVGWRPAAGLELSLGLQNLLDPRHPEIEAFDALVTPGNQIGRSAYGKITWRF